MCISSNRQNKKMGLYFPYELGKRGGRVKELLGISLLFVAMIYDVYERRIPNWLILLGICMGTGYQFVANGMSGVFHGGIRLVVSVLVLFLFYQSSALGAGDLKLISMMSLNLSWKELEQWLVISGCFAVLIGTLYYLRKEVSFPFGIPLFLGMVVSLLIK